MISYYKRSLIDTFGRLKEIRENHTNKLIRSLELQKVLIKRIVSIEKRIHKNTSLINSLKELLARNTDKADLIQKSSQIKALRDRNHQYKGLINIFKAVGDGLAFLYLNQWDVKPLVFKEPSGFVSGKVGLTKELAILEGLFKVGKIAILNDITNCLRYGDITMAVNGFPYLIEVKSSRVKPARTMRQIENADKMLRYLASDRTESLYGVGPVVRVNTHCYDKNYIKELNECIELALADGFCVREIEKGLTYYIESRSIDEAFLNSIFSKIKKPLVFFANEVKHASLGYYPFTLSIESPEQLYDFYRGRFLISVIVDLHVLSSKFLNKGLEVDCQKGPYPLVIRRKKGAHAMNRMQQLKVSDYMLGRIGFDFWSLSKFASEAIKLMHRSINPQFQPSTASTFPVD